MPTISSSLSIQLHTSFADIAAFASEWNRLAAGVPFRRWDWQATWWRHFGDGHQLFVLTAHDGDQCVGIAPFFVERIHPMGHVVRIMGAGEVCSDYQSILAEAQHAVRVGTSIAMWFVNQIQRQGQETAKPDLAADVPDWSLMELSGVDGDCPTLQAFLQKLQQHGFIARQQSLVNTWLVPLPAHIDDYIQTLSKPCRRKVRGALKRFKTSDCDVSLADSDEDFERIWDAFVDLHQRRRNSLGEAGCFASDRFTHFLFDAAKTFRSAGLLDLVCVTIAKRPVAIEICFRGEPTTFAYQVGIEPDSLRENPGWLANTASIQRAISLQQTGFDLCRGDEQYKRHLGAQAKPCVEIRVVPPELRSQLWNAALVSRSTVQDWLKTSLSVTGIR